MDFRFEKNGETEGIFFLKGSLIGEHDGMPLADAFNEELENGVRNFVLDLQELKHINSSGIGVFITLLTKARKRGGDLYLAQPSEHIKNLLLITKLNSIFQIFGELGEAVETLKKG